MKNSKWKSFLSLILILIILYLLISRKTVLDQEKNSLNHVTTKDTWVSNDYVPDQRLFLNCSGVVYVDEDSVLQLYVYGNSSFTREIELYMNDTYIGNMHDDGQDGDEVAGDEKYSFEVTVQSTELNEVFDFYAKCGDISTEHCVLYSYHRGITQEEWNEEQNLCNAVNEKISEYLVDGYVPINQADYVYEELYQFILRYIEENNVQVLNVNKEKYGISVKFSSGIPLFIDLPFEGVETGSNENICIRTLEPYCTNGGTQLKSFEENALYIQDNNIYCINDLSLKDENVTIENIVNAFTDKGIIIWHGHGSYSLKYGSLLCITTPNTEQFNKDYEDDILNNRIVILKNGTITLSSLFFDKYLQDIDNSVVYLGACLSYNDSRLASSFLNKNASAVFGFTETVYTAYDCAVMDMLSEEMCKGRDMLIFTLYQDIKTSLKNIKNELGDNDIEYAKRYMNVSEYKDSTSFLIAEGNLDYYVGDYLVREKQDSIEKDVLFIKEKFRIVKEEFVSVLNSDEEIFISLWEKLKEKLESWLLDVLNSINRVISPV